MSAIGLLALRLLVARPALGRGAAPGHRSLRAADPARRSRPS